MKLHLGAGIAVGLFGTEVALSPPSQLALVMCTMLVIAAEAMNGSLEALVDLHTLERRPEARAVKDAAAGAVLALAAGSVLVLGCVVTAEWASVLTLYRSGSWSAVVGDVAVVGCAAALLGPGRKPRWPDAVVAAAGGVLLALAAWRSLSVVMTGMSVLLLVIATAASRRPAGGWGRPPAPATR